MTRSRSAWYFLAAIAGLSMLMCAMAGRYGWAVFNGVMCFLDCALAASAPDP